MADPRSVVDGISNVVQSAQGGYSAGSSKNGYEAYVNTLNLAGTLLAASPFSVGINGAALTMGTVDLTNKWMNGNLSPSDVMGVTSAAMGLVLSVALVAGAPITITAMLIATGAAIVAGPFVQDWFNNEMTGLGTAITDALTAPMPWDGLPSFNLHNELNVSTSVNTYFNAARPLDLPHDPLALDLDGDGIETIGVGTVLFDHNGDGIRTGTGWLKGDDGFLVLDRNGNGVIDNGGELFGVDTIKSNGQRATDGFDALRDLDSNGDGIFDANDEQFSNVRVWRDLNQDGISQANELFTLEQLGIASINLTPTTTNVALGGGNTQTALGTFARSDGSTGAVGNAAIDDGAAANLNLAQNPFYREFTDPIELTEATQNLPEMHGSGAVRDLREAATLNTNLAAALSSVQTAGTREALDAQLNTIIVEWAKSADFPSTLERLTTGRAQASPFMARISETNVTGAESAPPIRGEEAPSLGRFTAMDGFQSYYQLPDSFVVSDEMIAWA